MLIFAIDDEAAGLRILTRALSEALPDAQIRTFQRADDLVSAVESGENPDLLFTDAEMPVIRGDELARWLKTRCPSVYVIFTTGYDVYKPDDDPDYNRGYLMKPVTVKNILTEIAGIHQPVSHSQKRIWIQTFGRFEVYSDGKPVAFARERTEEYLALLVDRAVPVSHAEAARMMGGKLSVLDIMKLCRDLNHTLKALGCEELFLGGWNRRGVRTELVDCDLYGWRMGIPWAINQYRGEYMSQYYWASLKAEILNGK